MGNWWEEEGIDLSQLEDQYAGAPPNMSGGVFVPTGGGGGGGGGGQSCDYDGMYEYELESIIPGALDIMQLGGLGLSGWNYNWQTGMPDQTGLIMYNDQWPAAPYGGWATPYLNTGLDGQQSEWEQYLIRMGLDPRMFGGDASGGILGPMGMQAAAALAGAGFSAYDFLSDEPRDAGGGYGGYPGYGSWLGSAAQGDSGDPKWIFADPDYGIDEAPDWFRGLTVENDEDLERQDVQLTMAGLGLSPLMSNADMVNTLSQFAGHWDLRGEGGAGDPWDIYTNQGEEGQLIPARPQHEMSMDQMAMGQTGPGGVVNSQWYGGQQFDLMRKQLQNMQDVIYGQSSVGYEGAPVLHQLEEGIGIMQNANLGTRAGRQEAMASLDPWLAQFSGGELAPYRSMAQAIANPFFANLPGGLWAGPQRNKHIFG